MESARLAARVSDETLQRLDSLVVRLTERSVASRERPRATRSHAARIALERGIEVLERELAEVGRG